MSAAEKLDVQTEIKNMLVNHPDSADAVMYQLKDELFSELVPDEQFRELLLEVNNSFKNAGKSYIGKMWMTRVLKEFFEFIEDTNRDAELIELLKKDDYLMDKLREDEDFKEILLGDLPTTADLDSDGLIGEVMRRYHAHDMDIRHFINDVQLNNPLVMQRRR